MATAMTWVGLASIVGATCAGPLFDRFDGLVVLSFALLLQGLAIGAAPWCRILVVFQVMAGISSVFNIGITTGKYSVLPRAGKNLRFFLKKRFGFLDF